MEVLGCRTTLHPGAAYTPGLKFAGLTEGAAGLQKEAIEFEVSCEGSIRRWSGPAE